MKNWGDEGLFHDVRWEESRARQLHTDRVAQLRAAIALADGLIALENAPAYSALRKALEDKLEHNVNVMMAARSDREAAVAQGSCVEIRSILALVRSTKENRQALANELEREENTFRELEKTFKPVPGEPR